MRERDKDTERNRERERERDLTFDWYFVRKNGDCMVRSFCFYDDESDRGRKTDRGKR